MLVNTVMFISFIEMNAVNVCIHLPLAHCAPRPGYCLAYYLRIDFVILPFKAPLNQIGYTKN